jgi:hypothetical protein
MTDECKGIDELLRTHAGATGLTAVRENFAWEPNYDQLFALGWPHLRTLLDGHEDDTDAGKHVATVIDGSLEGHYFVRWPRQVALRYVRAFGCRGSGALTTKNPYVAAVVEADAEPVTAAEAKEMLAARVRAGGPTGSWFVEHFILLLEAMVGTEVVLDGLTESLAGEVGTDNEVEQLGYMLGFLLLRVDAGVAANQRAKLEAILERTSSGTYLYDGLACSLGGAAAARSMGKNPVYYHHANDEPAAVLDAVEAGEWLPSARHVFLGGEAVLEAVAPYWKKQNGAELQRKLARQLAPIRSPVAVRILAEMSEKSKAKKQVPAICAEFTDFMLPELAKLTSDPVLGAGARTLVSALGSHVRQ